MRLTLPNRKEQGRFRGKKHRFQHRHGNPMPITNLKPGDKGVIASIHGNHKVTQRLADLGLTPETGICMLKAAPFNGPIEVAVRGSKLVIGREIAESILVQTKGT